MNEYEKTMVELRKAQLEADEAVKPGRFIAGVIVFIAIVLIVGAGAYALTVMAKIYLGL